MFCDGGELCAYVYTRRRVADNNDFLILMSEGSRNEGGRAYLVFKIIRSSIELGM
jgi:hypothetical protein